MGDSVEQWRATIGLWSGGRPRQCVTLQHHIAQNSTPIVYKYIRFLVLISVLVIGCVELNPGPNGATSAPTQNAGVRPTSHRRPGTSGLHGGLYEVKMATYLFARALNKADEFKLASNVRGVGAFDDLVLSYRLRDVRKTCFIQLTHKENGGTIKRSCLTKMPTKRNSHFCLLKYFISFCEIKNKPATDPILKQCGPFVEFEFVIYTNGKMQSKSPFQGGNSDPLNILSSGTDCGKYIAFDKDKDKDIFEFFEDLSKNKNLIAELDSLLKGSNSNREDIKEKINALQNSLKNKMFLNGLKEIEKGGFVTTWIHEVAECDFTLFEEFLNKVKIFQDQSNEESLKGLIEKELQQACKASPSVANFIYTKFEEGFSKWRRKVGKFNWLNENSELWQEVQEDIITEINNISKSEIQEIDGCDIRFKEEHVQKLTKAIKQNTVLNIVTNSPIRILQKLKTRQALNILDYKESLFIGINPLKILHKEIRKLWPCKWSNVLVVDCGSDCNVAHTVLDILQQSADCEQGLDTSDENKVEHLADVLQKYEQKAIFISTQQKPPDFQEKLRNISDFEDNCDFSDLDETSQRKILESPIKFQGTNVALSTLVGSDPPNSIKALLNSEVISILLSNEHDLSVGRQLDDHPKYYVPRVLQHQIYLKEDILKLTDYKFKFAISGLQADELKNYLPAGEKICEPVYDETGRINTFKIVSDFSKVELNTELDNMKIYNEAVQNVKPEEVRYIILGNKNSDSEFKELKELCTNVQWIHVENGSFLWRDSNCKIDVIREFIVNKNILLYDTKSVVGHKERTMLLVAEPGMGKSTFLSYLPHEIKKWETSIWVLRINLIEHTSKFKDTDFENEYIDQCKMFLWSAANSPEQDALKVTEKMFLQALEGTGRMVIILDGFDEISPNYSGKVKKIISVIRDETAAKIWISTRLSYRQELEEFVGKFAFTLQPFTPEDQVRFLEKYWTEVTEISNKGNLEMFAKKLLSLCSQNFSDKDGEFTCVPLQTMMLGEAFFNEAKEYCHRGEFNLPEKFNLIDLFRKFTEKKIQIYFGDKQKMDTSKPEVDGSIDDSLEKHMIPALLYLFSEDEFNELNGTINESTLEDTKCSLREGKLQKFGIIREIAGEEPHFVHRCFAEYFAAKWLTDNFRKCKEFISNVLFNSTKTVTRKMFDRMLANDYEIHVSVLNSNIDALNEILKKGTGINSLDKGGRTALHLAASYNSPYIQQLLSLKGSDPNTRDAVLDWTPITYADRTKSWMAMDILLQNGANPKDIVFTREKATDQEWGQAALWDCASKGYIKLLESMLNYGIQVQAIVEVAVNLNKKFTLLHRASCCGQVEIVRLIAERGADINSRDANNNTALHLASAAGSVDIIELLLDKGMSVNVTNTPEFTPLHVSARFGHLESTKILVQRGAAINNTNKHGHTPLMVAAYNDRFEICRYLTYKGANIHFRNGDNNTAIRYAAKSGNVDIIKLLLDKGMSVNEIDTNDSTPLHVTAQFGRLEATKLLVANGADIDKTNKYGNTPLMFAACKGKFETFRYLTERGADINIRGPNNNTVLHYAAESGSVEIMKLLLEKFMYVNLTDTDDSTALHVCAAFGHLEATKLLVKNGAAISNTDKYGNTPLMLALYNDKLELCHYLKGKGADINIRGSHNY